MIRTKNHAHQGALPHKAVILKPLRESVMLVGHIEHHGRGNPPASKVDQRRRRMLVLGDNRTEVCRRPPIATEEKSAYLPVRFRGAGEFSRAIAEVLEKIVAVAAKSCRVKCNDLGRVAIFQQTHVRCARCRSQQPLHGASA